MQRTYSRRDALRFGVAGSAGLVATMLVSCGDDDDDDDDDAATPSEPASAGTSSFPLVTGWYREREVRYYDFADRTKLAPGGGVATAPIYALITGMDADGMPEFVEGQMNIIDVRPEDQGYSDLWQVMLVTVPDDYEANTLTSQQDILDSGYEVTTTDIFVNCPVVDEGSTLEGGEELVQGWYKGEEVFYPDFGPNPPVAVPIWAFITGMDADGMPQFVEGQMNIIDLVPEDAGYSAFWLVNLVTVPDDYGANSIRSADAVVSSGYEVTLTDIVVNCPVVDVA